MRLRRLTDPDQSGRGSRRWADAGPHIGDKTRHDCCDKTRHDTDRHQR